MFGFAGVEDHELWRHRTTTFDGFSIFQATISSISSHLTLCLHDIASLLPFFPLSQQLAAPLRTSSLSVDHCTARRALSPQGSSIIYLFARQQIRLLFSMQKTISQEKQRQNHLAFNLRAVQRTFKAFSFIVRKSLDNFYRR
jgi:hypothetical protein